LSPGELKQVAAAFAEKLNRAQGPVCVMLPLKGWSSVDYPGNATFDPEEDRVFNSVLREKLNPDITVTEVDANMEDPAFAEAVAAAALKIFS
jgi:uncharacterized protein (UPF0261 family)